LKAVVDAIREPIILVDYDRKVKFANRSFFRTFQVSDGKAVGKHLSELGDGQWDLPELGEALQRGLPADTSFQEIQTAKNFAGIGNRILRLNVRRIDSL